MRLDPGYFREVLDFGLGESEYKIRNDELRFIYVFLSDVIFYWRKLVMFWVILMIS